ncbi:MAG: quinol monooxygenase YgiN, partial [Yoonia sp.]
QDHMSAPHVKAFQSATDGILTSVELFEMTLL